MPWPKQCKPHSLEMPATDLDPYLLCQADLSGIRELILTGITFVESPFGGRSLAELRYFPNLRTLIIHELWYATDKSSCLREDFVKMLPRKLVDLEISTHDNEVYPNFFAALKQHTTTDESEGSSLMHLGLSGMRLQSWDGLSQLPLRKLFLSPNPNDDEAHDEIFLEISRCQGLRNLRIENMALPDDWAREIALASRLTLETFCAHQVPYTESDACHLLTSLLNPRALVCVSRVDVHRLLDYRPSILSRSAGFKRIRRLQQEERAKRERTLYQGVDAMIQ